MEFHSTSSTLVDVGLKTCKTTTVVPHKRALFSKLQQCEACARTSTKKGWATASSPTPLCSRKQRCAALIVSTGLQQALHCQRTLLGSNMQCCKALAFALSAPASNRMAKAMVKSPSQPPSLCQHQNPTSTAQPTDAHAAQHNAMGKSP